MLQPTASPEQALGPPVLLQRHPAVGAGIVADQLGRFGQAPAAASRQGGLCFQQQPALGIAGVAAGHLQGEHIHDLHPRTSAPRSRAMQRFIWALVGMGLNAQKAPGRFCCDSCCRILTAHKERP